MKLAPRDIDRFLRAPDAKVRVVLVYGPDGGLVRERTLALVRTVAGTPDDPFRVSEVSGRELAGDPARLGDEAAAQSLSGGRRVVRVRDGDDALAAPVKAFLAAPVGEALVVVEAGDLPARAALRKAVEAAALGATMPCYRDDQRSLSAVIVASLAEAGLEAAPDALAYLAANLGGDRLLTRRELEKLALYMASHDARVELEDAQVCVGDSAALSLEDLGYAVGSGDPSGVIRALERTLREGAHPVRALRAVARHFQRLHLAAGLLAQGVPLESALKRLRPPPFWKVAARFGAQARAWPLPALAAAGVRLIDCERACKRTGAPAEALCARALLDLARAAPAAQGRRSAEKIVSLS